MASVFITADFNTPVELNKEKVEKMKSIKEKYGEIPFVIEDNKIFLFSASCFEIHTRQRSSENSFVFQFFEGVRNSILDEIHEGGYYLGVASSDIVSQNLLKELYELFEEIQLDVSMYESYGGEFGHSSCSHIDVKVNSKGEWICVTDDPMWECEKCFEFNEGIRTSCDSCLAILLSNIN